MNATEWVPTKAPDYYSEDEVRQTPLYQSLCRLHPSFPDEVLIKLAQTAIEEYWAASQEAIEQAAAEAVVELLEQYGFHASRYTIDAEEMTIKCRNPNHHRFSQADYVHYIGQEFVKNITTGAEKRQGTWRLIISEPPKWRPNNMNTSPKVTLRLVDPDGYETRYPPRDWRNPKTFATYREVRSPTAVTSESRAGWPQSPAVIFGLQRPGVEWNTADEKIIIEELKKICRKYTFGSVAKAINSELYDARIRSWVAQGVHPNGNMNDVRDFIARYHRGEVEGLYPAGNRTVSF